MNKQVSDTVRHDKVSVRMNCLHRNIDKHAWIHSYTEHQANITLWERNTITPLIEWFLLRRNISWYKYKSSLFDIRNRSSPAIPPTSSCFTSASLQGPIFNNVQPQWSRCNQHMASWSAPWISFVDQQSRIVIYHSLVFQMWSRLIEWWRASTYVFDSGRMPRRANQVNKPLSQANTN